MPSVPHVNRLVSMYNLLQVGAVQGLPSASRPYPYTLSSTLLWHEQDRALSEAEQQAAARRNSYYEFYASVADKTKRLASILEVRCPLPWPDRFASIPAARRK